jgi:hypothetical protein
MAEDLALVSLDQVSRTAQALATVCCFLFPAARAWQRVRIRGTAQMAAGKTFLPSSYPLQIVDRIILS